MTFQDLILELTNLPEENFIDQSATILTAPINWAAIVHDYLMTMQIEAFTHLYIRTCAYTSSPEVFLLYDDPHGKFRISLNHFDSHKHKQYFTDKKIIPHLHHFSFATRLLQGGYLNWIYKNEGNVNHPNLKPHIHSSCKANDVYKFLYDIYHIVLSPTHDTISLMIRGRITLPTSHAFSPLDSSLAPSRREIILGKLKTAAMNEPTLGNLLAYDFS